MCPYAFLHVSLSALSCVLNAIFACVHTHGGTQLLCNNSENRSRRRDKFLLRGVERVNITKPGGQDILSSTALCCEAVCFVGISGWRGLQHLIPGAMLKGITT